MSKSIKIKRNITVKTVVTEEFKKNSSQEITKELQLLDNQIMQLELQSKQMQDQLANDFTASDNAPQIRQAVIEISQRLTQFAGVKQELLQQRENINGLEPGNLINTGSLENYVEISEGDNIYEKYKAASIIVKDGIIQEIKA
jgi:hypothetical protein